MVGRREAGSVERGLETKVQEAGELGDEMLPKQRDGQAVRLGRSTARPAEASIIPRACFRFHFRASTRGQDAVDRSERWRYRS